MIRFDDTKTAFEIKSNAQLKKSYYIFRIIKRYKLVNLLSKIALIALKIRIPIIEYLVKISVFNQFCGGRTKNDCQKNIDKIYNAKVCSILDYSVEGKSNNASFDRTVNVTIEIIEYAKDRVEIPFVVFKPTGIGSFDIYKKVTEKSELSSSEQKEWDLIVERHYKICDAAKYFNVFVMIDAEESWIQGASDKLVEKLMQKYNREKPLVYGTLQMYRKDRFEYLKYLHEKAEKEGFIVGVKIVRGAYMEKERERAKRKNYISPINEDKKASDDLYNRAVGYVLDNINKLYLFAGTHNEESTLDILMKMKELNISSDDKRVWFGQLYGMGDHISFNLSKSGYNVAKYMPFGPVRDVIPYLIRRAEENTSVSGQSSRELDLIEKEMSRRGI
ncbi:proline dehydrogenase family protein [Ichthyobacterium seriolicida]|uniref:Carbapenem antibiotics biosynthesis protein carD n=1 Tax=Ichthyobacterium seriolicida TaxID=242600 RepID=A0A1J1E223_9FLAO|nr:proline dehydrogenase family protein [Ichthyobacterium seriolicida]BAV95005.1 carbapenem antibiotics biosynthesis protein carD [Ichthyobacterium seriolicida]